MLSPRAGVAFGAAIFEGGLLTASAATSGGAAQAAGFFFCRFSTAERRFERGSSDLLDAAGGFERGLRGGSIAGRVRRVSTEALSMRRGPAERAGGASRWRFRKIVREHVRRMPLSLDGARHAALGLDELHASTAKLSARYELLGPASRDDRLHTRLHRPSIGVERGPVNRRKRNRAPQVPYCTAQFRRSAARKSPARSPTRERALQLTERRTA